MLVKEKPNEKHKTCDKCKQVEEHPLTKISGVRVCELCIIDFLLVK